MPFIHIYSAFIHNTIIFFDGNVGYNKSFHSFAAAMSENEIKDRIRQAAEALVMQYGIRSVSMDDIAANLGMSKKTIYQYFRDKEELVDEIVAAKLNENQCTCTTDKARAENAVQEIFLAREMVAEMMRCMNPSILFDMQKYHPAVYERFRKHKNDFLLKTMKENLKRGIDEGLFREDIHVDIIARFRVESVFIPFNPDFIQQLNVNLVDAEKEIIIHYVFGIVTPKGYKLVQKYLSAEKLK